MNEWKKEWKNWMNEWMNEWMKELNDRIEWLPDIKLWQIQQLHHHLIVSSLEEEKKPLKYRMNKL